MTPLDPNLIVCETEDFWLVRLRRAIPAAADYWRSARSLVQCDEALTEAPQALVVLDLAVAPLDAVLDWMSQADRRFPGARLAIVGPPGSEPLEPLVRQSGALYFGTSSLTLNRLGGLVHRQLAARRAPHPDWTRRVWASLPWND